MYDSASRRKSEGLKKRVVTKKDLNLSFENFSVCWSGFHVASRGNREKMTQTMLEKGEVIASIAQSHGQHAGHRQSPDYLLHYSQRKDEIGSYKCTVNLILSPLCPIVDIFLFCLNLNSEGFILTLKLECSFSFSCK